MARRIKTQDDYYLASQWQLMLRKLKKHRLAQISFFVLAVLYIGAIFGDFIAPYGLEEFDAVYKDCAPTQVHYVFEGKNWLTSKHLRFTKSLFDEGYATRLDDKCEQFRGGRVLYPSAEIAQIIEAVVS